MRSPKSLSVRLPWIPIWGNVVCPPVCLTLILRSGVKWHIICPSVSRGFQYDGWNVTWPVFIGFQWNVVCLDVYLDLNIGSDMAFSLSICLTWISIWGLDSNIRGEMKCIEKFVCLSVLRRLKYENEMHRSLSVSFSYVDSSIRVKWYVVVRLSVLCRFQYEGLNEL